MSRQCLDNCGRPSSAATRCPGGCCSPSSTSTASGPVDRAERQDDAVVAAIHDQCTAGLDVITDGEQTRLDFNLSFYGYLEGIELEGTPPRRFGPPAHDQRGRHHITGELAGPVLKACVPGPYTMSRTVR
jgi:5-methyltetrahydropteroyltriglutamate--homocysteine methyltransferase